MNLDLGRIKLIKNSELDDLQNNYTDIYNFFEFVEQYDDVWNDTQQKFLGIGVAIRN